MKNPLCEIRRPFHEAGLSWQEYKEFKRQYVDTTYRVACKDCEIGPRLETVVEYAHYRVVRKKQESANGKR